MPIIHLKSIKIDNGETLGYREREGGRYPLVLVHGNMTSSKHWDLVLEHADPSLKIYALDLRGFGMSSYHVPIREIKDFSNDLKLFVDALGLRKFALMGWSMGGCVSMSFAANYPEYVDKLILLASGSTRGYPLYFTDENGRPIRRVQTREEVDKHPKTKMVIDAYNKRDKNFLRAMFNMVIYTHNQPDEERYQEYLNDILTQRNLPDVYHALNIFNISTVDNEVSNGSGEVRNITAPTLVLWGKNDLAVTEQMTMEIMQDMGNNAVLEYLEGCGHSPLIDDLDQLLNKIHAFLLNH